MKRLFGLIVVLVFGGALVVAPASAYADKWQRLSGDNAIETAGHIAFEYYSSNGGAQTGACVATVDGYWDALSAAGLAGQKDVPVLFSFKDSLGRTAEALDALYAQRVYVMGGPAAISDSVERTIAGLRPSPRVERIYGDTAAGTAVEIHKKVKAEGGAWGKTAIVVTVDGFYDALSASPYSYAKKAPMFLSFPGTGLKPETIDAIRSGGFTEVLILGGTAAVPSVVERSQLSGIKCTRIYGDNAIGTSIAMAKRCLADGMDMSHVGIATSAGYHDGVCAGPLCGKNNSPLLLVRDGDTSAIDQMIKPHAGSIQKGYIFGGTAAVSAEVEAKLRAA
ncbi:cell wall-binding repeat-containing protein [Eggerthellaceae bacterium zg-1084]|uniref:cell wall-binding repeat-containing protein n=1 Tax=Berryella wangjianweii TaxID=2734634 RepID=UPI00155824B8|nr:cell wall-binding repeat-containing protein [Berryella wangjianweii]NPD31463.1 cell wall-binding repeat-containing protein [Berryella wangjianweii]